MKIINSILFVLIFLTNISLAEEISTINNNEVEEIIDTTLEENVQENSNNKVQTEENKEEEPIIRIKDVKDANKADVVILQALNKITAKTYKYEVKIGDEIIFERLIIEPLFCWKSSPDAVPENKVLIKITENKLDKTQDEIFYGWMFSSSPSISSLEHPMYDITIVDCIKTLNNTENTK